MLVGTGQQLAGGTYCATHKQSGVVEDGMRNLKSCQASFSSDPILHPRILDVKLIMVFIISSSSQSGRMLQRTLFLVPYLVILSTGCFLIFLDPKQHRLPKRLDGICNLLLLALNRVGLFGNHYVKVYSMQLNMIGLLVLLVARDFWATAQLLVMYWFPCIMYLRIVTRIPSISEIIPNKLYLGNRKVPHHPDLLKRHHITHILELTDNGKTRNDPSKVPSAKVLQLTVTDTLGSHESLTPSLLQQGVDFIESGCKNGAVLVHCTGGVSRSAAIIVYYLIHQSRGTMSLEAAYAEVRQKRPVVDISSDHVAALRKALSAKPSKKSR